MASEYAEDTLAAAHHIMAESDVFPYPAVINGSVGSVLGFHCTVVYVLYSRSRSTEYSRTFTTTRTRYSEYTPLVPPISLPFSQPLLKVEIRMTNSNHYIISFKKTRWKVERSLRGVTPRESTIIDAMRDA